MTTMFLSLGMISYQFCLFNIWIVLISLHESPTRDSPKKARAKESSTPSKGSKSVARQLIFDAAVFVPALMSIFDELTCIH
jgi:hypothetical protein